jgi:molecular chaperone GrpE
MHHQEETGLAEEIEVIVSDQEAVETTAEIDLENEESRAEQYFDQLRRLQAEFDNYRKRVQREREHLEDDILGDFFKRLLPFLDDLERALEHSDADQEGLRDGIELVYKNLKSLMETSGLSTITAEGSPFDPHFHEAVMVDTDPAIQGEQVTALLQPGYLFREKLLRPAKVKVSKGSAEETNESNGTEGLL